MKGRRWAAAAAALVVFAGGAWAAQDVQIVDVPAGVSSDVYTEVNLSGKIYLKIISEPGEEPCGEFWWIKWPLGNIEHLGRGCGLVSFEIPGIYHGAVASKLRVRAIKSRIKIAVSSVESVASSVKVTFP